MSARKFPVFALTCFLAAMATLLSLGTWQLHRLEWKNHLVAALDAEYAKDAGRTNLKPADIRGDFLFRHGTLRGTYDYTKEILIGPRIHDEQSGYHVLTPLKLSDGSVILVNRGWVPAGWREPPRNRSATVTGLLRRPDPRNMFTPANVPAKDQWYSAGMAEIAAAKNIKNLSPYILYSEGKGTAPPLPQGLKPALRNQHLSYALFWFTMAAALFVVFILRFRKEYGNHE